MKKLVVNISMSVATIVALIALIVACAPVNKTAPVSQEDQARRLFMESWSNPGKVEQTQLRAELAKNYADTPEGMFAKAWLANQDGDKEARDRYYRECLEKYPEFMPTLWNYNFSLGDAEKRAMREEMMRIDPFFYHGTVIRLLYDLETDDSVAAVDAFIAQWEKVLGEDHYIFDFIRALNRQYDLKDYQAAADYYEKALATADGILNFEVLEKYINLKMDKLYDPATMSESDRYEVLTWLEDAREKVWDADIPNVEKRKFVHKTYKLMAEKIAKINNRLPLEFYKEALDVYFTAEVAEEVYNILWGAMRRDEARVFLEDAAKKHPQNFKVLELLGFLYSRQQNYDAADEMYRRAIANAHTIKDRWATTSYYCDAVLYPNFRADEAYALLKPYAESFNRKGWVYNVLTKNRILAADYEQAEKYINMAFADQEVKGNTPNKYMKNLRKQVAAFVQRDRQLREGAPVVNESSNRPLITAMTNVDANWVAVSPDGKYFFGNAGKNGDYTLWDAERFVTLKTFDAFLSLGRHITYKDRARPLFSADGKYIAHANTFKTFGGELVINDSVTGRLVAQQAFSKKVLGIAWNASSSEVAVLLNGALVRYDVATQSIVAFAPIEKHVAGGGFVWTADGKELAFSEKYEAGKVRVFDAQTLKETRQLNDVDWPHALGMTRDGRYLISADNNRTLHVWDRQNDWQHQSMRVPALVSRIVAHPDKPQVILNDWGGRSNNQVVSVDVEAMKILATTAAGGSNLNYFYLADGGKVLLADHKKNEYHVFASDTLETERVYRGEAAVADGGCHADPKSGRLLTWDQDGLHVWDAATGEKLHTWPGEFESALANPDDSSRLFALQEDEWGGDTNILILDLATFKQKEIALNMKVNRWGIQNGAVIFAGTPPMPSETGSEKGIVKRVDLATGLISGEITVDMVTELRNYARLSYSRFKDLEISPDNSTVALYTAWGDGWRQDKKVSAITRIYSFDSGQQIRQIDKVGGLAFLDNNRLIVGENSWVTKGDRIFDIRNGAEVGKLEDEDYLTNIGRHSSFSSTARFTERNLKVSLSNDNRIEFRTLDDDKLALTILSKHDNEWLAYTPEGEFSASANGARNAFRTVAGDLVPLASVKEEYARPGIIQKKLAEITGAAQ